MPLIEGRKFSCSACIKGHRASKCPHADRELFEVQKKGRPSTQCTACKNSRSGRGKEDGRAPDVNIPPEAAGKRPRGRNSKALLAIERAKAKGAVICHVCVEQGDCSHLHTHSPSGCPLVLDASSSSGSRLEDIGISAPLKKRPLPALFVDPHNPDAGPVFHNFPPSLPVKPEENAKQAIVPSVEQQTSSRGCCSITRRGSKMSNRHPSFESVGIPDSMPPSYQSTAETPDFSLSLHDLSHAAYCEGPCRPDLAALDPLLAELFVGYTSAQPTPPVFSAAPPPTSSVCGCASKTNETALPMAPIEACSTCGPACRCGSACRCGKMASLSLPVDFDVDALLKELLAPMEPPLFTPATVKSPDAPRSSCCCNNDV